MNLKIKSPAAKFAAGLFYLFSSSGRASSDISREIIPAMPAVLSTNCQLKVDKTTDVVPMLAMAV